MITEASHTVTSTLNNPLANSYIHCGHSKDGNYQSCLLRAPLSFQVATTFELQHKRSGSEACPDAIQLRACTPYLLRWLEIQWIRRSYKLITDFDDSMVVKFNFSIGCKVTVVFIEVVTFTE